MTASATGGLAATNAIIAHNDVLHSGGGIYMEDSTARLDVGPTCVAK